MIPDQDAELVRTLFAEVVDLNPWQWAERSIDYSRARNYDSEWKGPYSVDYLPFMREPLEACADMSIKEVWCWAATRAGKSENLLLTVMRWMLAQCPPYAMLYIGGQQSKVEQFFEKRILRGMALSEQTAAMMTRAKVREHTVDFAGVCDLIVSWAANKQVAKGDSFPVIFADEVSSWPGFKADVLRERQAVVPFPKLIGVSSADAESRRTSEEDPIIQEWEATDRREYMMEDPGAKGQRFLFRMGGKDTIDGVRWDRDAKRADGSWDLEAVEQSAHYVTPSGYRVEEKDRIGLLAGGVWAPTAKAPAWKRGYRVTRMMTPFPTGRFGNMARTYLEAIRKQKAGQFDDDGRSPLRVFFYERLAEKFYLEKKVPELSEIENRRGNYRVGEAISETPAYKPVYIGRKTIKLLTCDIQKASEWWTLREWIDGGDSGLIAFGQSAGIAELREIGMKARVKGVLIDNSYEERAHEMIEHASGGLLSGAFLCYGRDNIKDRNGNPQEYVPYIGKDPYEGTARQGRFKVNSVTHHPDRLKAMLYALSQGTAGHLWRIPMGLTATYAQHMTAEQCTDGRWSAVRKDNHLWDCEVLQLLGSKLFGLWRDSAIIEAAPVATDTPKPAELPAPEPKPTAESRCEACGKAMVYDGQRYWQCRCGNARDTQSRGWGGED